MRDVKGLFDLKGVHYFVSMSDEAASAFQIWSRGGRNEFHSSFYQVINVEQGRTEFFNAVVERRGTTLSGPVQSVILISACGVPREFVRLVETLTNEIELGDAGHLAGALGRVEIEAFRRCLLSGAIGADDEDGLLGAYRECDMLADRMQSGCGDLLVASNWTPEFLTQLPSSATKDGVLLSAWRRTLVRLAALGMVGEQPIDGLLRAVQACDSSPAVARLMITRLAAGQVLAAPAAVDA